ncbi:MAG: regulatory protein RecX [Ignavibacteria bacterium]
MIITKISKIKDSVHIQFDNDEKLILRYEVFLKNSLRKDDGLDEKTRDSLIRQNQFFYVKESAFRFLGCRLHSAKELERKLLAKKYDAELVNNVICNLKENNYLNDEKFARDFTSEKTNRNSLGINRIIMELKAKGISKDIIELVLSDSSDTEQVDQACKIAQKKLKSLKVRNLEKQKLQQKIYSYLLSKGFNYDIIKIAIESVISSET